MFGTAPNPDDVSVLANGAMENSEYDLRKQMNIHTHTHKMNIHTKFTFTETSEFYLQPFLQWFDVLIESGPIELNSADFLLTLLTFLF